ncbi:unnamed protein product [Hyaloperonospora brassicae]|uniref:Transmembrane protein 242 n=1 Tax=Hyaloperonospora brassicae TaxID=162125 RepID=A0AAV0T7T0_HYABA|nr:unnamed protein product [Hyaloperonospora brassicae]
MSDADDTEVDVSLPRRTVSLTLAAVSTVAVMFLGGGFYYGLTTQKKALVEEEKSFGKTPKCTKEFKPKSASFFERKLALNKPLPPGTAAWKALLGVTVVSVAGCCVVVGGAAACLGLTNINELQKRLQKTSRVQSTLLSKHLDVQDGEAIDVSVVAGEVKEGQVEQASEEIAVS